MIALGSCTMKLNSTSELTELNFLYIENAISELNIKTAKNKKKNYNYKNLVQKILKTY